MARWRKRFEAWANAKQPVSVREVEATIYKVFEDRVRRHDGGSHRWRIDVNELQGVDKDFLLGSIGIPVRGKVVLPCYLKIAYRAAELLGLPQEHDNEQDDED
ncbi:MAG: hypothetical protein ABIV13_02205 [Fimbriimonadales bacterium]